MDRYSFGSSTSSSYRETQQSSRTADHSIKCSNCGMNIQLLSLEDHECKGISNGIEKRRKPEMRLDTGLSLPRSTAYGNGLSAHGAYGSDISDVRSPTTSSRSGPPSPGYLGDLAPSISRSISSNSSATSISSSKVPFLQAYQKFAATAANGISGAMFRNDSGDNKPLPTSKSSPTFNSFITQDGPPTPRKFSASPPSFSHSRDSSGELPYSSGRISPDETSPRSQSSGSSKFSGRLIITPASSVSSSPQPLRKGSNSNSNPHSSEIHSSRIAPVKLSGYSPTRSSHRIAVIPVTPPAVSRNRKGVGLDTCLEDLRLIADDDEEDVEDDYVLDDCYGNYEEEIEVTPRNLQKRFLPHSQSTPTISSSHRSATVKKSRESCNTCLEKFEVIETQRAGDGQTFCRPCYADRFLPKCRKCKRAIEGGAVTSSDGKVVGKYHPHCFSCFKCSAPFPDKEFYVWDQKPYCQLHYHELNGSLCTNDSCFGPIEGQCVSLVGEINGGGGRYHPNCFKCSHTRCLESLEEHHYVVKGLPYCDQHASIRMPIEMEPGNLANSFLNSPPSRGGKNYNKNGGGGTSKAKKRYTIITRT